jgi:hypothetical protein
MGVTLSLYITKRYVYVHISIQDARVGVFFFIIPGVDRQM